MSAAPDNITAPQVTVLSDSALRVCWTVPASPNGVLTDYVVVLDDTDYARTGPNTLCATVTSLTPNTAYAVRIKACTADGCGTSPAVAATTRCAVPDAVVPYLLEPSQTSVLVAWQASAMPRCSVVLYRLQVAEDESASILQTLDVGQALNATVTGLTPNRRYVFRVEAISQAGSVTGSWTSTRTLYGLPLPVAAPNLEVISSTQLFVAWMPPSNADGALLQYEVFQNGRSVANTSTTLYRASGLQPYTNYSYSVRVCATGGCVEGASSWVFTAEATPTGLAAPIVAAVTSTSLSLTWLAPQQPNGVVASYTVYLQSCSSGQGVGCSGPLSAVLTQPSVPGAAVQITGLTPYSRYQVRVEAQNGAGSVQSAWTDTYVRADDGATVPLRTLAAVPQLGATPLICVAETDTRLRCSWSATTSFVTNGPVLNYHLLVSSDSNSTVWTNETLAATATEAIVDGLEGDNYTVALTLNAAGGSVTATTRAAVSGVLPSTISISTTTSSITDGVALGSASDETLASGGIIGIVIAGVVLLLLIAMLLVLRSRRSHVKVLTMDAQPVVARNKDEKLDFWEVEERLVCVVWFFTHGKSLLFFFSSLVF